MAKMSSLGCDITTLILGEGITSRGVNEGFDDLKGSAIAANKTVGCKDVRFSMFPDNCFDSTPMLEIVKAIEELKTEINPHTVFTHFANDLNIDHKITNLAVQAAFRPQPGEACETIYSFEVSSSTEWSYPQSFSANVYVELSPSDIHSKIIALNHYKSEMRDAPHSRSIDGLTHLSSLRGFQVGVPHAEAFQLLRSVKKGRTL